MGDSGGSERSIGEEASSLVERELQIMVASTPIDK